MGKLRTLVEVLGRGRTLRRHIVVSGQRQPLYVSPDAQLKYLRLGSTFDHDLILIAETFVSPGAVVWDVGANVGSFFVAAASRAGAGGMVLAVEADPWLASVLERTRQLPAHRDKTMSVLCAAASSDFGLAEFNIAKRGRAANALADVAGSSQMGGVRYQQPVCTIPLDALLTKYRAPDFVKIDVEGAEALVLAGMSNLMALKTAVIYAEVAQSNFDAIKELTQAAGYSCFDIRGVPAEAPNGPNYFFVPEQSAAMDTIAAFRAGPGRNLTIRQRLRPESLS